MQERLGVMAEDLYTTKSMDATVAERRLATVPPCPLGCGMGAIAPAAAGEYRAV